MFPTLKVNVPFELIDVIVPIQLAVIQLLKSVECLARHRMYIDSGRLHVIKSYPPWMVSSSVSYFF